MNRTQWCETQCTTMLNRIEKRKKSCLIGGADKIALAALVLLITTASAPAQQQSSTTFAQGSVPVAKADSGIMSLTLGTAMQMAMKNNLAGIESSQSERLSRGQRLIALSSLLPSVNGAVTEHVVQSDLTDYGIHIPGVREIQGPFQYQDARVSLSQTLFSASSIQRLRSTRSAEQAANLNITDAQEVVVLTTGTAYLAVIQAASHVTASAAQVQSADALYKQALNTISAGTGARIDVTRTEVQLETERYNLLAARNSLAITKITLARVIGLPLEQEFTVPDDRSFAKPSVPTLDVLLKMASDGRADLAGQVRTVQASSRALSAAKGERLPEVSTSADYGANGTTFGHSHGTMNFQAGISIPIFTGGRVKGDIEQAKATLAQKQAELENLRGQVDADVRTAYLNVNASQEQVDVAHHSVDLANENLSRSRDRFQNGVADSVEVVQAEQSLAAANDQLISSTYTLNVARLNLARATGSARTDWKTLLGDK